MQRAFGEQDVNLFLAAYHDHSQNDNMEQNGESNLSDNRSSAQLVRKDWENIDIEGLILILLLLSTPARRRRFETAGSTNTEALVMSVAEGRGQSEYHETRYGETSRKLAAHLLASAASPENSDRTLHR